MESGVYKMKTVLPKNHKHKKYVGKNGIQIRDLDCLNYKCFQPHNRNYIRTDGTVIKNWVCNYRDNHGCPDYPEKEIWEAGFIND